MLKTATSVVCPQSSLYRRLRGVLLFGLFLTVAFTVSTSGTGSAPTLAATTTVVKPGENVVGTAIAYGNSGVYYSAYWRPGSDEAEALVGKFAASMPNGALPAWSRSWPGSGGFDMFMGADVGADGVYFAGSSYSQTTDSVGGKERKEIVARFNLDGAPGGDTAGAAWVARQRFYPGSNNYDGDEFFNAARVSIEGGTTYVYGAGHAQSNGCNNNYAIRKYTASGATVWQWQQIVGACGGSDLNAIVVNGSHVYAAGFSNYAGNLPQILQFSTTSGSAGPSATFSGTRDGYATGAYTSIAVHGGNIYAAGYLGSGEQQVYLLDVWNTSGTRVAHNVWSSDATKSNGQQLMGIAAVGSRLFVAGYTRNTDNPAAAHNIGGNTVALFPNNASYHGFGDGVIFEVRPSDGSLISTTSYGTNDGNDQAFTGVTTDGTDLYVIGAQRSAGVYSALVQRYSFGPTATTLTMPVATGTFGGTTTLQATLSSASGPVSGMPVIFSLSGAPVGSAPTDGNGVATLNNVALSGPDAGIYEGAAGASFADTASYQTSSTTADLTINRAPASISVTGGGTFPNDGSAHSASGLVTGVFGESLGAASIAYTDLSNGSTSSAAPIIAGSYRVNASFAGNTNYLDGSNSSITITIAQASTNVAPVLAPIGNQTVDEGALLGFAVGATDVDSASLTQSATGLPPGATFNPGTRVFRWTPGFNVSSNMTSSSFDVTFEVSDGQGGIARETIRITVRDVPDLTSIAVTPPSPTMQSITTLPFTATGTFSDGSSRPMTSGPGTWSTKAPMPTARTDAAAATLLGQVYIVGGIDNGTTVSTVEAYNPASNSWSSKPSTPTPRYDPAIGVIDNLVYVAGGCTGGACAVSFTGAMDAYDPVTNNWTGRAAMGTPRFAAEGAVLNGLFYVAGGQNGNQTITYDTLEVYNPATNTWSAKAPMPRARTWFALVPADGLLYAIGGYPYTSAVDAYDPQSNTWSTRAPLSAPRVYAGAAALNGKIVLAGGFDGSAPVSRVDIYDPLTDTWSSGPAAPSARYGPAAATVNGTLYTIGGCVACYPASKINEALALGDVGWTTGTAAIATINLTGLATALSSGTTTITATNGLVSGSTLLTVQSPTTTSVSSNANPSVFGQPVTFTATLTSGSGTPAGTVQFKDGATTLGTGTLSSGTATFATAGLAVGSRSITASYAGDTNFAASTSSTLSQVVNPAPGPTVAFSANPNPAACHQIVVFDGSGSSASPGLNIVDYAWSFGDGSSASGQSLMHSYGSFGTFAATLTVTDNNSPAKTATMTHTVVVNQGNQAPVANPGGPYGVNAGSTVQLNGGNSFDPNAACGDSIVSYAWTIDGTIQLSGTTRALDTAVNSLGVGSHNVSLTVTDELGATGTASTTLNVQRILVSIAVTPSSAAMSPGQGGQQFTATGTFSDSSTAVLQSSGGGGGSVFGPSAPHWSIHFSPMIGVSACATAEFPGPIYYSSQAFTPDSTGAFQQIWSPSTPVVQVDGLLTPTQVTQTLRCTSPALSMTGEVSATWTGAKYEGTFSFGGSTGQVSITGWSSKTPMPTGRVGVSAMSADGKVYAIGGVGGSCGGTSPCNFGPLGTVESYDPVTNAWTAEPSLNVGREGAGVAALAGKRYVVGGHVPGGNPSNVVEVFDPSSSNAWTMLPESEWMPTARANFALVTDGTYLYALGGSTQGNNGGHVATVERYDPSAHTWTTLTPMPVPGTSNAAGVLNGTIVVAGSDGTSRTDVYDIATNTWHDGAPMPAQRGAMAAGVANGGLWVVGGTINGSPAYDTWAYYPATGTRLEGWARVGSMPTARWGLAAAVVDDVVYAIGGATDASGTFLGLPTNESVSTPPLGDLSTSQGSGGGGGSNSLPTVQWQSTNPAVAGVDSNGFANPHASGQTTIVASAGSISCQTTSSCATLTVSNVAPAVQIFGGPFTVNESQFQNFGTGGTFFDSGANDGPWTGTVDYGDGGAVETLAFSTSPAGFGMSGNFSLNHTYRDNGTYTVRVTVTDNDQGTGIAVVHVNVDNVAPQISLPTSSTTQPGSTQNFGCASFSDRGTADAPWSASVDYGDGGGPQSVTNINVPGTCGGPGGPGGPIGAFSLNHSYNHSGTFTVVVTVTDKDGGVGTRTVQLMVNRGNPTMTLTSSQPQGSTLGDSVTFTAAVTGPAGVVTPTGTVAFKVDGNTVSTLSLDAAGHSSFSTNSLSVGNHNISATYDGDGNFFSSSRSTGHYVNACKGSVRGTVVSHGAPFTGLLQFNVLAGGEIFSFTTNSGFFFDDVEEGAYHVQVVPPSGLTATPAEIDFTVSCGQETSLTFEVADTTPPMISLNGANLVTVEGGATFTDPGATATDAVAGDLTAQIQVTGAVNVHAVGSYTLTYSVSDGFNTATRTRTVNVVDTTPPALTLPANLTIAAATTGGAMVSFNASAFDIVDGIRPVNCAPASGSTFPVGTTTVSCTSADLAGNTSQSMTFTVTVTPKNARPPKVTAPKNMRVEATGPDGASVSFTATAIDPVYGALPVTCAPASGAMFPLGATTVACAATNDFGKSDSDTFIITVRDTTDPAIVSLTPSVTLLPDTDVVAPVSIVVVVSDLVDPAPACRIARVAGGGKDLDNDGVIDWTITGDLTLNIEAVARRNRDRTYTITVKCTDASGNTSAERTAVVVSHRP